MKELAERAKVAEITINLQGKSQCRIPRRKAPQNKKQIVPIEYKIDWIRLDKIGEGKA